ncbi:leucine-rich repeat-containing protein [Anaeramoeba flamelloides]|uniref:Leucine-rich repeat-containing protein n=1 Tax=Anaeramoeba flamelloides TaxID=1746091 RepID=A0AAV7YEQ7_9EUKA|nr:leucine-rich repeat-containing protein [Anaeramoeba flamelloides]
MTSKLIKEGWVSKIHPKTKQKKKRYLVLYQNKLETYPDENKSEATTMFVLKSIENVLKFSEKEFAITVKGHNLIYESEDSFERERWASCLKTAILRSKSMVKMNSNPLQRHDKGNQVQLTNKMVSNQLTPIRVKTNLSSESMSPSARISLLDSTIKKTLSPTGLRLARNVLKKYKKTQDTTLSLKGLIVSSIQIPFELWSLKKITTLNLSEISLHELPLKIVELTNLEGLIIQKCQIKNFPSIVQKLPNLKKLDVSGNNFEIVDEQFETVQHLTELTLRQCQLTNEKLKRITSHFTAQVLNINNNAITKLPKSLGNSKNLKVFYADNNSISFIPKSFSPENLNKLFLKNNLLKKFPLGILNCKFLQVINFESNTIIKIPKQINELTNLQKLLIRHNLIMSIPLQLFSLSELAFIDIRDNLITKLPIQFRKFFGFQFDPNNNSSNINTNSDGGNSIGNGNGNDNGDGNVNDNDNGNGNGNGNVNGNIQFILKKNDKKKDKEKKLILDINDNINDRVNFEDDKIKINLNPNINILIDNNKNIEWVDSIKEIETKKCINNYSKEIVNSIIEKITTTENEKKDFENFENYLDKMYQKKFSTLNKINKKKTQPKRNQKIFLKIDGKQYPTLMKFGNSEKLNIFTKIYLSDLPLLDEKNLILQHCQENLQTLKLTKIGVKIFPLEICKLTQLRHLSLVECDIMSIPIRMNKMTSLVTLRLEKCQITKIPKVIGQLTNLQNLNLRENRIKQFKIDFKLIPDLKILDLSKNSFKLLPLGMHNASKLKELYFSHNYLSKISNVFQKLKCIKVLNLNYNNITEINENIFKIKNLKYLKLKGNMIKKLPIKCKKMSHFALVDISKNLISNISLLFLKEINNIVNFKIEKNPLSLQLVEILQNEDQKNELIDLLLNDPINY